MLDTLLSAGWYVMTNDTLLIVFFSLFWMRSVNTPYFAKAMVYCSQMTFQFPKPFFGSLFIGTDAFDSESLAVRNTFGAMIRMTTLR
jgi:hypothetical protein